MCDYCDCRSHAPIAALSADHERLVELLASLRAAVAAGASADVAELAVRLHDALAVHAAREEQGVFRALRQVDVDEEYLGRFEDDHKHIHTLIAAMSTDGWEGAARRVITTLSEHIAREESDLFPAAHQLLAPAHWDVIDAVDDELIGAPR